MIKLGVLASGNGTNLQSVIDEIERGTLKAEIRLLLSDRSGAEALSRAEKHEIPTALITKREFPVREDFDERAVELLKDAGVELVVLAGFMRLITDKFLKAFPARIINIHPSLLPAFPGLGAQRKAVEYGVKFSGCTVHFVDGGLDSGPIINQAVVPVLPDDTPESLQKRILAREHIIYPEAIRFFSEGRITLNGRSVTIAGSAPEDQSPHKPASGKKRGEMTIVRR